MPFLTESIKISGYLPLSRHPDIKISVILLNLTSRQFFASAFLALPHRCPWVSHPQTHRPSCRLYYISHRPAIVDISFLTVFDDRLHSVEVAVVDRNLGYRSVIVKRLRDDLAGIVAGFVFVGSCLILLIITIRKKVTSPLLSTVAILGLVDLQ